MSKALYRKYRSKNLTEVVGQSHITTVLQGAIEQGKIAHAYLFTGPRGVGKTSIARILAHQLNNLPYDEEQNHPDIIEIDAASNNSVEDIRDLRERIQVAPFSAKYRIYIIDEVHMLSKSAFNALLKTLEEPPAHAIFILATTDSHKLPATIISRTQQFNFHLISAEDVINHLDFIARSEEIAISRDALAILAEKGGGSFRDSISLLDQISSLGREGEEISGEKVEQILGLAPKKAIFNLIEAFETQNIAQILSLVKELTASGTDLRSFLDQFLSEVKKLLPQKPHLIRLISPLTSAKNSPFIETEILTTLIAVPQDFVMAPAMVGGNNSAEIEALRAEISSLKSEISQLKAGNSNQNFVKEKSSPKVAETSTKSEIAAEKTLPKIKKIEEPLTKKTAEKASEVTKSATEASNGNQETLPKVEEKSNSTNEESKSGAETSPTEEKTSTKDANGEFNWTIFVRSVKEKAMGLGSILGTAQHKIENNQVKIYTGSKIKKNQIEKAQNRTIIAEVLAEMGAENWQIEAFAENKPFDDPTLANVAAIMGGGTEVKLNE